MHKLLNTQRGFSLIELAVVLLILALLAGGVVSVLRIQQEQKVLTETRAVLNDAREALFAYAEVHKGLPCPDTDGDGLKNDGCSDTVRGKVPWKNLGLSRGDDAWNQALHYVVSKELVEGVLFKLTQGASGVTIVDNTSATGTPNADTIAFAIWSNGIDGIDGSAGKSSTNTEVVAGSTTATVDDIVTWGSKYVLFGRILQAGQTLSVN
ncbi:prepilin-type N-terminal cleavage/methylation domain-containing protein [Viridibacterium curvum]|uniref:Prepilin-type N-terminal cleavage/methylation domain-containing protein n=1 Tax=Viridibacterium curvum TaxID=1101404 RepID=A0ABP9R0H6_9RHOO